MITGDLLIFANLAVAGTVAAGTPKKGHKKDIITYLKYVEENGSVGGFELGSIGPVAEGLFTWIFGLGFIIAITVWLGAKAN